MENWSKKPVTLEEHTADMLAFNLLKAYNCVAFFYDVCQDDLRRHFEQVIIARTHFWRQHEPTIIITDCEVMSTLGQLTQEFPQD